MSSLPVGILFVNLGTPVSPNVPDVKNYLKEFLMDPFVIDIPVVFRWLLVNGIIAPFRSPKSAHAYLKIWQKEGSPLLINTKKLAEKMQTNLGKTFQVEYAMRYGDPSIKTKLAEMSHLKDILVVPMYPQYAESTVRTIVEQVNESVKELGVKSNIKFLPSFYKAKEFINSLAHSFIEFERNFKSYHVVMSYHGLPERHVLKTDATKSHCLKSADCCKVSCEANINCYSHHCFETSRLLSEALGLAPEKFTTSFQSRLGRDKWLTPSTEDTLVALAKNGNKKVLVIAPSFLSDCLETLEEINMQLREKFLESGGEDFKYIPCLNSEDVWVENLTNLIEKYTNAF